MKKKPRCNYTSFVQLKPNIRLFLVVFLIADMFSLFAGTNTNSEKIVINTSFLQQNIEGNIVDESGNPLPGVNIVEAGTQNGTMSDFDGNFNIPISSKEAILIFSSIGFETQEITVNNTSEINVVLKASFSQLDEVVVVGYGSAQKKDITGAVSSISDEDMNEGAISSPLQLIAGKAAGVNITQIGSEPGSSPSVRIRGITSLMGGNDPLIVVDGIQGNMDLLNDIPTNEIASIDILKDASATAVFGSRGAAGVIIVTTKKNKEGTSNFEFSSSVSVDYIPNKLDMLGVDRWWEQAQLYGVPTSANHGSNTDWYGIMTRPGSTQNYTVSFGGGTDKFNYRASVSAILQEGVVINSSNQKYIGRLQATQKAFNNKLTLTMNLNTGISNTDTSIQNIGRVDFKSNLISQSYFMRPTDPVLDTDNSYYADPNVFQYLNPYAVAETSINEGSNNNLLGSLNAELELAEGLKANWFGSWRKTDNSIGFYLPVESTDATAIDQNGFANIRNNKQNEKLMNISLTYKKDFDGHSFNLLGLYEWQNQSYQGNFSQARGFINDLATYNALQLGEITSVLPGDISSYKNDRTLVSFLFRVNYSYKDRYLVTFSERRDGASVFGANNKWGNFPSTSLAWRINKEPFLENSNVVNDLKLRFGYGETGNQQGLYPQNSISLVGAAGVTYFAGQPITNFNITQNTNGDLKWETKKQTNIGLDFELFESRFRGTIDAFTATTDNLLFNYTVPQPPFPYGNIMANVGSIVNKGLEVTLGYDVIRNESTTLTLAGNVSFIDNEVKNLSGSINGVELNTDYVPWGTNSFLIEGRPIGTFNILEHTGKDDVNAETVLDRDGDGTIDQGIRSADRQIEGSALPTYYFSFNPSFRYKNFDASLLLRGSGGNKIYNRVRQSLSYMESIGKANVLESAVPLGLYTSKYGSDLWLEDGSFIRLDNLNMGYSFLLDQSKYIKAIRVSLTGNNLFLITNYSGLDPELNLGGGNGFGQDGGIYPRTRSFALGLNVKFK